MAIRLFLLVVLFSTFTVTAVFSAPALLYGIYPEYVGTTGCWIQSVSLDPNTGVITKVSDNFYINGNFDVQAGVSALDNETGVYMYATDFASTLAYQTNVFSGKPLAALDVDAETVVSFTADPANRRILALVQNEQSRAFQVQSVDEASNKVTKFADVPSTANLAYQSSSFIDPSTGDYVLLASSHVDETSPKYRTFTFASNGTFIKAGPVIQTGSFEVIRAVADPRSASIVALMNSPDGTQNILASIDLNGHANVTKIATVQDGGVVAVAAFSVSNRTMYFIEDGNGSYLHKFAVDTLTDSTVAIQGEWYFYNLEASA
eukprot:TRINITY_DN9542_c0_g1_i1.p1 TRINITY_DN9542_c0_g1~~TRINITY_DN9542_c0_g1_i1.p1  ORF type:complete len:319 (-),score=95.84 TRINITY_DN9542_c0_g1_i1:106-1062(-)